MLKIDILKVLQLLITQRLCQTLDGSKWMRSAGYSILVRERVKGWRL
jgi:hypothetical protein